MYILVTCLVFLMAVSSAAMGFDIYGLVLNTYGENKCNYRQTIVSKPMTNTTVSEPTISATVAEPTINATATGPASNTIVSDFFYIGAYFNIFSQAGCWIVIIYMYVKLSNANRYVERYQQFDPIN